MIRKLIKRLGVLLACLVLIPVILIVVGGFLLPKDKIRTEVATRLEEATGAQVELGNPGIKWWPQLGISLDGGSLKGTGVNLAQATGSDNNLESFQVDLEDLNVQVALGPLLKKQVEVDRIIAEGPLLVVVWDSGDLEARDYKLEITDLKMPIPEKGTSRSGPEPKAVGDNIPEELAFSFKGQVQEFVLKKIPYQDVAFEGELDTRIFTVESLLARLGEGQISGSGEIDYERDPHGELDFEATAEMVPAADLLGPFAPELAARLKSALNAEVSGTCNLKDQATILSSLSINGDLDCAEGVLTAEDWLKEATPYLKNRQDLKTIRFRELVHAFRVDEGKYLIEELEIDGHETDWAAGGWVGLDGVMNTALKVKLPPGFTPDLGQWTFLADSLRDEEGRVNLAFTLSGQTAKPHFGIDFAGLQGGTAPGANDSLKKGLGGLLDKWKTR